MKVFADLVGTVPGWGVIKISGDGLGASAPSIALRSIQTGAYLQQDARWQSSACWHEPAEYVTTHGGLRLKVGPALIDGINSAPGRAVALLLRYQGQEAIETALAVPRRLFGSQLDPGAQPPPLRPDDPCPLDGVPKRGRRVLVIGGLIALSSVFVAFGLWRAGWLDESVARFDDFARSLKSQEPTTPAVQGRIPLPSLAVGADTDAVLAPRAPTVVSSTPTTPAERWAEGERLEQLGNCSGAEELFLDAAGGAPELQYQLAQRLDPATVPRPHCAPEADPLRAENLYFESVSNGVLVARRRLAEMMLARGPSRSERDYARQLLRAAAQEGDVAAARLLDGLDR